MQSTNHNPLSGFWQTENNLNKSILKGKSWQLATVLIQKGALLVYFMEAGTIITLQVKTLYKLYCAMITHVHTRTIQNFRLKNIDNLPYTPDLAPSDYHLFLYSSSKTGFCLNDSKKLKSWKPQCKIDWNSRWKNFMWRDWKMLLPDIKSGTK